MIEAKKGLSLIAFLLPLLLNSTNFITNDLLTPKASQIIEDIGNELTSKTGIYTYVIATNRVFPEGFNLVEYVMNMDEQLSKPFVVFIFAPNAVITRKSGERGRVGLIPSSKDIALLYDSSTVKDYAIGVVATKDKNSKEDKYNIGVVQSYSELADQIADSKDIEELTKTIPNDTHIIVTILQYIVLSGTVLLFWIFFLRPRVEKVKNGK
ncbi:MAG: hypothetical protein JJV88_00155 [Sulfurovum sp.]|nr:hypothetical protein [Sulfurovaceae bacterium]